MGPGSTYTMLVKDGRHVAALSLQQPDQAKAGIPPHWTNYVSVTSADDVAAKAQSLGGQVVAPPFDVFDSGRMAVIQDSTGAIIAVWQAKRHIGAGLYGDHGALCWAELLTNDTAKAERFYTGLFGWTTQSMEMPTGRYTVFLGGGQNAGGMMAITPKMGPTPPNWMTYFVVADCAGVVERAERLGGATFVLPMPIPGVGTFATLVDPQGAVFSLLQPSM